MSWLRQKWRRWRRPKGPVVSVQTHEFSFPPTDASLCCFGETDSDPRQSVAFTTTNVPHHVMAKIEESGVLVVTRVGAASEQVEASVKVVEFCEVNGNTDTLEEI